MGLDKAAGCKQNAFVKHSDTSHKHLKFVLNMFGIVDSVEFILSEFIMS